MIQDGYDFFKPARNPIEHGKTYDPELIPKSRKIGCRYYNFCLSVAEASNWDGFSCLDCRAFEKLTPDESLRDHDGIISMLVATWGDAPRDSNGDLLDVQP